MGRRSACRARGVTRFEVLTVIGVLAGAAVAAALVMTPRVEADRLHQAERDAVRIQKAAREWRRENGSGCPTLTQLVKDQQLTRDTRTDDPWGDRFRVICSEQDVSVSSAGRDRVPNTTDDIRVPRSRG